MIASMKILAFLPALMVVAGVSRLAGQAERAASCNPVGNIRYVCGLQAPEDLVLVPGSQWVLASSYAGTGGINLINVRDHSTRVAFPAATAKERPDAKTYKTCPGPPDAAEKAKFVTHGLALRAGRNSTHTLYAVHHGSRESIEVFEVDARARTPTLTWCCA